MTDPAKLWWHACQALEHNHYEQAYEQLQRGFDKATNPEHQAHILLYLASLLSLYGEHTTEDMSQALQEALHLWPATDSLPLYLALHAEVQARTDGPQAPTPAEEARFALGEDGPLARYHTIVALSLSERYPELMAMSPAVTELPPHLRWRLRQWQASSEEALGNLNDAAHLYAEAAYLAQGIDRATLLQEQAAILLQQGQYQAARSTLAQALGYYPAGLAPSTLSSPEFSSDEQLSKAGWYYLQAQLELALEQPEQAAQHIQQAAQLEQQYGEGSYGVALVHGQILSALGRSKEAISTFQEALARADETEKPYAHHELGVALLDLDRPLEAREYLEYTLQASDYPYAAEVLADIAESDYRLGRLPEAQQEAEAAMQQGATVPASLVLGSIAMEYYHLDEALGHYQRVIHEAAPGSRDWVVGHQMAADILAQQGFSNPQAIYAHAQQALEHTDPSDEWYATLEDHLQRAGALLEGGSGRTLN